MSDIVEKLRNWMAPACPFDRPSEIDIEPEDPCPVCGDLGTFEAADGPSNCGTPRPLLREAAAEITRLRADLAETRADFTALQKAIVGNTGLSAIQEATRLRAQRDKAMEALRDAGKSAEAAHRTGRMTKAILRKIADTARATLVEIEGE